MQQVSIGSGNGLGKNIKGPGGWINIKMPSYQYGDSNVKDKTVSSTILSLTWESLYLEKMGLILSWDPGVWPQSVASSK